MDIQIVVGGVWLATIGRAGELTYSHGADGGCLEASWKMDLPLTSINPALRRGSLVRIMAGPECLWQGILSEPDADDDWTFTAQGLSSLAEHYLCFDASMNATTKPNTAVDWAINNRGLPWTKPNTLSSPAFVTGDVTEGLQTIKQLLDAWSSSESKRWGVNADGEVYAAADPTVPTWHLTSGSGRFGLADDEYASDLFVRYLTTGGVYATEPVADTDARSKFGRREAAVDATGRGIIAAGDANTMGAGLLAKGTARLGYTNGLEVTKYQLTTPGGTPAPLALIKGQQMVRQFGLLNEQGQPTNYVDWVIGETHYEAGSETIGLTPTGLVPRTLADVLGAA